MTIEREMGHLEMQCDGQPRCGEILSAEDDDFDYLIAQARNEGWGMKKHGDFWVHLCPDHNKKQRDKLAQMAKDLI